jgi:hypothetical protein
MPAVPYYRGRPASFWIAVMSAPARATADWLFLTAEHCSPQGYAFQLTGRRRLHQLLRIPITSLGNWAWWCGGSGQASGPSAPIVSTVWEEEPR